MLSLNKKISCLSTFLIIFIFILVYWPNNQTKLVFCDVGQGDATLLTTGFFQVLIDAGPDEKVIECLDKHMPFWDRSLDFLIATHMDSDHIGGMSLVLKRYLVKNILVSYLSSETETVSAFKTALLEEKKSGSQLWLIDHFMISSLPRGIVMKNFVPGKGSQMQPNNVMEITEGMLLDTDSTAKLVTSDKNALSIVTFLSISDVDFWLMGDLPSGEELAMIEQGMIKQASVIKIGHHGAKTSSSMELLTKIRPETAVISVGKNNRYHHPDPQVIKILLNLGVKVYRTSIFGDVRIVVGEDGYDVY